MAVLRVLVRVQPLVRSCLIWSCKGLTRIDRRLHMSVSFPFFLYSAGVGAVGGLVFLVCVSTHW